MSLTRNTVTESIGLTEPDFGGGRHGRLVWREVAKVYVKALGEVLQSVCPVSTYSIEKRVDSRDLFKVKSPLRYVYGTD